METQSHDKIYFSWGVSEFLAATVAAITGRHKDEPSFLLIQRLVAWCSLLAHPHSVFGSWIIVEILIIHCSKQKHCMGTPQDFKLLHFINDVDWLVFDAQHSFIWREILVFYIYVMQGLHFLLRFDTVFMSSLCLRMLGRRLLLDIICSWHPLSFSISNRWVNNIFSLWHDAESIPFLFEHLIRLFLFCGDSSLYYDRRWITDIIRQSAGWDGNVVLLQCIVLCVIHDQQCPILWKRLWMWRSRCQFAYLLDVKLQPAAEVLLTAGTIVVVSADIILLCVWISCQSTWSVDRLSSFQRWLWCL